MNRHPFVLMTPPGSSKPVHIDELIAPLIKSLWEVGVVTSYCCQGSPENLDASDLLAGTGYVSGKITASNTLELVAEEFEDFGYLTSDDAWFCLDHPELYGTHLGTFVVRFLPALNVLVSH